MLKFIQKIRKTFSPGEKWMMCALVLLLFIGSLLELAGIGAVLPVITAFVTPESVKKFSFIAGLLFLVIFPAAGAAGKSGLVQIDILASADLHGAVQQYKCGVMPVIAGARMADPQVVYVDLGDSAQGTFLINKRRGAGFLKMLSAAGCDIWVPGNHELEYGFEAFKRLINELDSTAVLAANLQAPELAEQVQDVLLREIKGVKVAFIGLMLQNMNNSFPVAEVRFQTLPGQAVLRRCIQKARAHGAEIIVLLRHVGKYGGGCNLSELLKNAPEVDLVIGAHSHQPDGGCQVGNAWYVQPPPYGEKLLKVSLYFDIKKRQLQQIESGFIELEHFSEPVTPEELVPAPSVKGQSPDFPADLMQRRMKSDLAIYAVNNRELSDKLLENKNPTIGDYFRVFPYFDPVVTVEISAGELREVMREYWAFAHKRKQLLTTAGFICKTSGKHLHEVVFAQNKDRYRLAISAYVAAGAGGQLPGIRRIMKDKIDYAQAEKAPGILEILTGQKF